MDLKPLIAGVMLLSSGSAACGSKHSSTAATNTAAASENSVVTELNGLLPASDSDVSAESSSAMAVCVPEDCPEVPLFGSMAPGCCRGSSGCGGHVRLSSRSWACIAPEVDSTLQAARSALAPHRDETIVPDPSCPSATLDGTTLSGCCDGMGYCGVSTEPWTAAAASFGLEVPSACVSRSEAARLADTPEADAGAPMACGAAAAG